MKLTRFESVVFLISILALWLGGTFALAVPFTLGSAQVSSIVGPLGLIWFLVGLFVFFHFLRRVRAGWNVPVGEGPGRGKYRIRWGSRVVLGLLAIIATWIVAAGMFLAFRNTMTASMEQAFLISLSVGFLMVPVACYFFLKKNSSPSQGDRSD